MAEVTAGELLIRIKADMKKLEDALNKSGTSVNTFSQKVESVSKKLTTAGMKMSLAVTVPLTLIGKKSLDAAMDVVESENLFEVSMGNMAAAARNWSEEFADSVGLNEYNVRKQVGTFNVMLTSMGLTEDAALNMSEKMTQLAYDMASFYNLEVEDAFIKIQGGITGEAESLKRLGIIVNETAVKQTAYKNGIAKVGEELTENQKIMARYQTIMEATSKAQGDMARTLDSPANQLRIFKEQIQLAAIELGKGLIPMMQEVIKGVKPLVEWFTNLNDTQKEWIVKLGVLAASGGPLMMATGQVLNFANSIKTANTAMKSSVLFGAAGGALPIAGIAGGIFNLGTVIYGYIDLVKKAKDGTYGWGEALLRFLAPQLQLLDNFGLIDKSFKVVFGRYNQEVIADSAKEMQEAAEKYMNFGGAVNTVGDSLGDYADSAEEATQATEDFYKSLFDVYLLSADFKKGVEEAQKALEEYNKVVEGKGKYSDEAKEKEVEFIRTLDSLAANTIPAVLTKTDELNLSDVNLLNTFLELMKKAKEMGAVLPEEYETIRKAAEEKINKSQVQYFKNLAESMEESAKKAKQLNSAIQAIKDRAVTVTTTYKEIYESGAEFSQAYKKYGAKQTGGEVVNTGIIPDLDVIGIKGEWLLNKQLVNAIKTSRTDSMGITASGGKSGGDVYLNVTIPGMVIREEADIKKLSQAFYNEVKIKSLGAGTKW